MGNGQGFKNLFEGCCHLHSFLPLAFHTPPSREFCSLHFTHDTNFCFFFKILFRFRFAQAAGRPFSLSLSTNFQSQPSFKRLDQYVHPSFCRRHFRRSFGNCECCRTAIMARGSSVVFVFIWLCGTIPMALSARLISPESGAIRTYPGLCEAPGQREHYPCGGPYQSSEWRTRAL